MGAPSLDYQKLLLALQHSLDELSSVNGDSAQSVLRPPGSPRPTLTLGLSWLTKQVIQGSSSSLKYVSLSPSVASTFARLTRHWHELAMVTCTESRCSLAPTQVDLLIQVRPRPG